MQWSKARFPKVVSWSTLKKALEEDAQLTTLVQQVVERFPADRTQ